MGLSADLLYVWSPDCCILPIRKTEATKASRKGLFSIRSSSTYYGNLDTVELMHADVMAADCSEC